MANLLSPGVYIEEVDASAIVPNVAANVAFLAGNFNDGPVDQPYVVTNKKEYENIFGTPTDANYNEWFQGYKFFDYANQLVVSRAFLEAPASLDSQVGAAYTVPYTYDAVVTGGTNIGPLAGTEDDGVAMYQVSLFISGPYDNDLNVGDYVTVAGAADGQFGYIWGISTDDDTLGAGASGLGTLSTRVDVEWLAAPEVLSATGEIHQLSNSHKNGGTQAHARGEIVGDVVSVPYASIESANIDVSTTVVDVNGVDVTIPNERRLSYPYDLIKNDGDFDYKYDQNELQSFYTDMKLKFIARNPNTKEIQIAIANSYDFRLEGTSNTNHAIAFQTQVGTTVENVYLTSLFDYAPQSNEIAIAIKDGDTIETYIVSMDPLSVDGNGRNNYVETVINENSNLIYVVDNQSIDDVPATYLVVDRFGYDETSEIPGTLAPDGIPTSVLKVQGGRNPKVSSVELRDAYFTVEDKERYEIDVIIGNEDSINTAIELAEARKDCMAYVGVGYTNTVGKKAIDATNSIINFMNSGLVTRSMYAAIFGNYFRIYDKFNKKYRWINIAGDMAGIRCDVSSNSASWWVSAGMKRGIIRNINKLAFTPSQEQRDNLYKIGVNPIVSFPGTGNLVWGNKTLHPVASSFDRINVRTLFNTIERSMAKAAKSQVFEFNDPYTRNAIMSMFNPYLSTIKAGRGITDYLVVCDETNNTPDVVSRNELKVDIYIKPNYAAEMILLTFTNVGTRSFSDVVGV